MKKTRLIACVALIALALTFALSACGGDSNSKTNKPKHDELAKYDDPAVNIYRVGYDAFVADSYPDYANTVRLNVEKYPELDRQGLRVITGYDDGYYAYGNESKIDTAQAVRDHFDPDKGIMIIINGLQIGTGRSRNDNMRSDSRVKELERFGAENEIDYFKNDSDSDQIYDLGKYWRDNGYNTFYFHWGMFADWTDALRAPDLISEGVWSRDNGVQALYTTSYGEVRATEPGEAILNGCVAELFAAEYLRMVNAIEEVYPDYLTKSHDIRMAGHSMGGVLTVASATLLHLLADAGEMSKNMVPNNLALMDSYMGVSVHPDLTIGWSGKKFAVGEGQTESCNYIGALKMLVEKFGVAAGFFCNEGYIVPFMNIEGLTDLAYDEEKEVFTGHNSQLANAVNELVPVILIRPYFSAVSGAVATSGHNPVREWYLSSLLYDAPIAEGGITVPTARMSDSDLRANRGRYFVMRNDRTRYCETVRCDDDTFAVNKAQ